MNKDTINIRLEKLRDKLGSHEFEDFHRRITSLQSNLVYWNKRLSYEEIASERQEAAKELLRCNDLLRLVEKDMTKAEGK
jgi:hypothetical protein